MDCKHKNNRCAQCSIRTDFPAQIKNNRKLITRDWMRLAIQRPNPDSLFKNNYACGKCYCQLTRNVDRYINEQPYIETIVPEEPIIIDN